MFQAFKKLTITKPDTNNGPVAAMPMSGSLQKKFSKGVQYNMKIIIKGDRNVGKTCLLERLQGRGFVESYVPTEEIQVASIQWSFKATEDIVKVEVWDVVDRGKARIRQTGLKLTTAGNGVPIPEQPALDAEFLDVYKGTHGVILMMDVTKSWTFDYVCKELPKIPVEIPVLILGNHCDMGHHRSVTDGQVHGLIETLDSRPAEILYGESSMRNGFGLRLLHKFLGLPFLRLQKDTLTALMERNQRDTQICSMELNEYLKSDDSDYNRFLDNLSNKRRQIADSNPKSLTPTTVTPISGGGSTPVTPAESFRPIKSIIVGGGQPIVVPGQLNITNDPKIRSQRPSPVTPTVPPIDTFKSTQPQKSSSSGFISNLFGKGSIQEGQSLPELSKISITEHTVASVDEFCPDGGVLDKSFLDDISSGQIGGAMVNESDSDDEQPGGNPLVARFHDEPNDIQTPVHRPTSTVDRVNPLAKNKSKANPTPTNYLIDNRKSSLSSTDDINIATPVQPNPIGSYDYDSWIADTTQRRSPEGGEDTSTVQIQQDVPVVESVIATKSRTTDSSDENGSVKEKKSKSHKKSKKDKRDREKDEKREKKKKRKSKEKELEDFLGGNEATHNECEYDAL